MISNEMVYPQKEVGHKFLGIVFFYMFIGLLITAGIATILGLLFTNIWPITDYSNPEAGTYFWSYMGVLIGASVAQIILVIWISVSVFKSKKNLWIPYTLYSICMGVLISSFAIFVPFYILAISFGLTCLCFGAMALLGYFAKGNLNNIGLVACGILIGAMLLGLFNLIFFFVFPAAYNIIYLIISIATFGAMMLITMYDVWKIKKFIERGEMTNNIAMFCAFNLYVDFIYLFIRIVYVVMMTRR